MKKKILGFVLAGLITVPTFAQEIPNAIFVDIGPGLIYGILGGFGIGGGYERALNDHFSVMATAWGGGVTISGNLGDTSVFTISGGPRARLYPLGHAVKGLFVDAGADFLYMSATVNDDSATGVIGTAGIKAGWKIVFGSDGGFFLEPGFGYKVCLFGEVNGPDISVTIPTFVGPELWLGLGAAF
jgi:hypothetical protein